MPTIIEAATTVRGGWRSHRSGLRLADRAGRRSLERAGRRPGDVDLLVNAGLYHDRNLGEPALAPLIQQDMGVNPADPFPAGKGTFSFDVANGSCGVLTGLEIVDGFLRSGTISTALIVASDADPGHGLAPSFPFSPAGGAVVCRWSDDGSGLGPFAWCNHDDGGESFRSTVRFEHGRNVLAVQRSADYPDRLADAAADAAGRVMQVEGLPAGSVDLVLLAPGGPGVAERVAAKTGIPPARFVTAPPGLHTVGLIAVVEEVRYRDRPGAAVLTTLLVAAGAGITAGAAVYRL